MVRGKGGRGRKGGRGGRGAVTPSPSSASFEAAEKAAEEAVQHGLCPVDEKTCVASLMTNGHYYRLKEDFNKAIDFFNMVKEIYSKESNALALNYVQDCIEQTWIEWEGKKPKEKSSLVTQKSSSYSKEVPTLVATAHTPALEEEKQMNLVESTRKGNMDSGRDEKTIKLEVNFHIGKWVGGRLHEGKKISRLFNSRRSFIEAENSQIDAIEELVDLGSNSKFIVAIEQAIDSSECFSLLVAEPLKPINSFFDAELTSFRSRNTVFDEDSRSNWWQQISESFKRIFGDVIHGLIYLNSMGQICGDLINHMYVNLRGEGKILPLMNKHRREEYDIHNLVKKMKEIITFPFSESEIDESYNLSEELIHLLRFVNKEKLKLIPFYWLVNHPYFWSVEERINFVTGFKKLMKRNVLNQEYINASMFSCGTYYNDKGDVDWSTTIGANVHDGLFKSVFDYSKVGNVRYYDVDRPCDIVRYMCNCFSHADDNYHQKKISNQNFSVTDEDLEANLRNFFPLIYINLYEALYHNATTEGSLSIGISRALEKWSRLYFAPKGSPRLVA